ncbi:hypothetical protein [Ciceribacter ferrooxidans]|uniref:hypothetical protein n=1 Tax=Ciceribacter ferrooxidans TaxID=2509717 RepID=UPI0013EB2AA1|nr:hypothetical protein [Ciceribacter ferrooxidans]
MREPRFWLWITPVITGAIVARISTETFGGWPGLSAAFSVSLAGYALFNFILNRHWTRK